MIPLRPLLHLSLGALASLSLLPDASALLVVHLPYDGTLVNAGSSGTLNDGIAQGDEVTFATSGQKLGSGALVLGGTDDWVNHGGTGASPVRGGAVRTTSVWVSTTATGLITPFGFGVNGTGSKWDMDVDNVNGGFEVGVGGGRMITSGLTLNDGNWHLLTATLPSISGTVNDIIVYVDGILLPDATTATTATNTNTNQFFTGRSMNNGAAGIVTQAFPGRVDDIAVWDSAFRAAEVKGLFDVGNNATLGYDAGAFDALKTIHDAGAGASGMVRHRTWAFATGLGNTAGLTEANGIFSLVLDVAAGTGLVSSGTGDAPPFVITAISRATNGDVTVTWNSVAGVDYGVEVSDNLATDTWLEIDDPRANGSTTTYTEPSIPPEKTVRFYRIRRH